MFHNKKETLELKNTKGLLMFWIKIRLFKRLYNV